MTSRKQLGTILSTHSDHSVDMGIEGPSGYWAKCQACGFESLASSKETAGITGKEASDHALYHSDMAVQENQMKAERELINMAEAYEYQVRSDEERQAIQRVVSHAIAQAQV